MEIKNTTPVVVKPKAIIADVVIPREHDIKVSSRNFILASSSAMNLAGGVNIPDWLNEAITAEIAKGTTDLATIVSNLDDFLRGLESGVNQQITALQTADEVNYSYMQSNVARLDGRVSGHILVTNTHITETRSSALALEVLTAQFSTPGSEANAWFINSNQATATAVGAHTESITGLVADYNGLTAQLLSTNYVEVEGEQWEVGASKLAYGPNGNITGWSFTDGSALRSQFVISADHFYIESSSLPSYRPFEIDGDDITFRGKVSFTNVTDVPPSVIQLLDDDWTVGSGSTPFFNINGDATENYRVLGQAPFTNDEIIWECRPDAASGADGGWATDQFPIDNNATYMFIVYVKTNADTGTTYLGVLGDSVCDLNTTTKDGNPYFWSGDLPEQNKWYLIVGFVYPHNSTGNITKGGIYDCTSGEKVADISKEFTWASDAINTYHRCYHYYDIVTTTRQYMWKPRVYLVDGNEPSISSLLGGVDGANTTTIDGDKIKTGKISSNDGSTYIDLTNNKIKMYNAGNGFTLDSTAAGNTTYPNIYGAYIKGGTIEAAKLAASSITYGGAILLAQGVTTGNESGRSGYSTGASAYVGDVGTGGDYVTLGTIVMPLYGSGFDRRRALSTDSNLMISITGSLDVEYRDVTTIYLEIQRSISGGTWTSVKTLSNPVYRASGLAYGSYSLSCIWTGTLAGISTTAYVSYRARLRVNNSIGSFGNLAGSFTLQN